MSKEVIVGIARRREMDRKSLFAKVGNALFGPDPVVMLDGDEAFGFGGRASHLVEGVPVAQTFLDGVRVVWGENEKAVLEILSRGYRATLYVSANEPSRRIKKALKSLIENGFVAASAGPEVDCFGAVCFDGETIVHLSWDGEKWIKPKPPAKRKSRKERLQERDEEEDKGK